MAAMHPALLLNTEVAAALQAGRAVVALESTLIAHGMPWPANVETARRLEAEVRAHGAAAATIAVLGGKLCVGLSGAQLDDLARRGPAIAKASRRDLPWLIAQGQDGATTVAATMIIAAMAGIRLFATGGIGGVHRGAAQSFDISADLQELARTDVAVVCAGAKAILDLPRTLELLETLGVLVLGFRTSELPSFYSVDSGLLLGHRVDDVGELAAIVGAHLAAPLGGGGILVCNPIPLEAALPRAEIEPVIGAALEEARRQGVTGKALTPFLLARLAVLTGGRSVAANRALALHNARVGGQLAVALRHA